jgi:PiT family inorganic phosphate transporter
VRPPQGFGSEAVAATVILASSHVGYPLSTTQVVSGAVTGSGVGRPGARVNWKVARRIVYGWLLTLPAAGAVGALVFEVIDVLGGDVVGVASVAAIGVVGARLLWRANRTKAVAPHETISENPTFGRGATLEAPA